MSTSLAVPYHLCPKCLNFRKGTRCPACGGFGVFLAEEIDKRGAATKGRRHRPVGEHVQPVHKFPRRCETAMTPADERIP